MGSPVNLITASKKQKNLLYNGGFALFQRNAAYSGTANIFGYTADRWGFFPGAVSNYSVNRTAHSNPAFALGQGRNAVLIQRNAGNAAVTSYQFAQTLERRDSQVLAGEQLTLSFSAYKGANYSAAGNILVSQIMYTLTNGDTHYITGWSSPVVAATQDNVLTGAPQRFSVTVTLPNLNIVGVTVNFRFTTTGVAGAADYFVLEDVMLEKGPTATAFESMGGNFAEELFYCQRYYEKSYAIDEAVGTANGTTGFFHSVAINGVDFYCHGKQKFLVRKRATPIVSTWSYAGTPGVLTNLGSAVDQGNTGLRYQSQIGFGIFCANNAMTTNSAVASHWAADAEL